MGERKTLRKNLRGQNPSKRSIQTSNADARLQDWLENMNANKDVIWPHLEKTYGKGNTATWFYRWQIFYMACAELFAYEDGQTWGVSHYLFQKP